MNTEIDWIANFKCRCSAISKMMSNSRSNPVLTDNQSKELVILRQKAEGNQLTAKGQERFVELEVKEANGSKVILSDGCIEYLMEVYAWETEGMIPVSKESMEILSISKGKKQEAQAAALLGFVDNVTYKVHKDRISNEYLSGEIDLYLGDSVYRAYCLPDIKNSWDYPTYLKKINNGLENGQKEQLQGYGDITGAGELFIANCLVDCTDQNIEEVKWRVAKKFDAISIESPEFLAEWAKWERSMKFSHIDPHKRVHKIPVDPFNGFERQKVYDKVKICRDWLYEFDEKFQNKNKSVTLMQTDAE